MLNLQTAAAALLPHLPPKAWLPWVAVPKANGKLDKVPACGTRTNDPMSWFTLPDVLQKLLDREQSIAGIGFAVTQGIIALDFDNCRDPATGELTPEGQVELERMNSFAYVTPSHKGFRVIGLNSSANRIRGGKRFIKLPQGTSVEVFVGPSNHYVTFTHEIIEGYETVRDISGEVLDYLAGLPSTEERSGPTAAPERGIEAIKAALRVLPNDRQDWDHWCYVGMAVWRSSGGSDDGFDAWLAWSDKNPCHDYESCRERWQHWFRSPPTRVGFGTLYHLARQANPLFVAPFDDVVKEAGPSIDDGLTGDKQVLVAEPFSASRLRNIPPRNWVYGHFLIRQFLSVMGAPGGTGKTAYAMLIAICVALNLDLLKEGVEESGNSWYFNLEDPMEELDRRVAALLIHHAITFEHLEGKFFYNSGRNTPLIVAEIKDGITVTRPIVDELIAELKAKSIRLLVIDPFVKSHRLEENKNEHIDYVTTLWAKVAQQADCAVLLLHHFKKGGFGGDADSFRGASSLIDGSRAAVTLARMGDKEAEKLGIEELDRRLFVRVDNAKLNLAPPPEYTLWLKLCSVCLDNGREGKKPDYVQAVERWEPPTAWEGLSMSMVVRILDKLKAGLELDGNKEQYTLSRAGKSNKRWAGNVVVEIGAKTISQADAVIKRWAEEKLLLPTIYSSPSAKHHDRAGLSVDETKLTEMRQSNRAFYASGEDD